ncbi:MAG: hypothetical protein J6B71_09120 [Clostridia bacterium]|nr:hypothetical protein [Clostridia bacterium]
MRREKKSNGEWKSQLLGGLLEVGIVWFIVIIGLGIAFLLPRESAKDIPFEVFLVFGGIVAVPIIAIIYYVVIKIKDRKTEDPIAYRHQYIIRKFQFLVDKGYHFNCHPQPTKCEFVYELKDACVRLLVDGSLLECEIKGKTLERTNVLQSPLVDEAWKQRFSVLSQVDKMQALVCLLKENAEEFYL